MWACQWPSSQPLSSPTAYGINKSHREQSQDDRDGEELSRYPYWSNSLWQEWSCGLVHCPSQNATDPIWRVLAYSDGISSWTPLKHQHSNPNPDPIKSGVLTSLILPHLLSLIIDFLPSLNLLCHSQTDARFMQHAPKAVWSIPYVFWQFFQSLKQNFIAYHSSKVYSRPDCIYEIHQLWQWGFSSVYYNCCCSCSFEPETIKMFSHLITCIAITYWISKSLSRL